eukprot:TRINITY_DN10418_c0_g1_i1.p1 TRINITY_DN10418_c0_g1~~TRINITY_DN10418_c0_g1_i1.p1  ORF type:complete len:1006 (-),score=212.92 TRINITY_DN10418_c0_g1_i1:167-2824(-)
MTPLHWAVYENNEKCVQLLLSRGAKTDIPNNKNQTAIDLANALKTRQKAKILPLFKNYASLSQDLPPAAPSMRDAQIAGLINLWGLIKYTHPYLSYRTQINWDKSLLDGLGKILELGGASEVRYYKIVDQMLQTLKDPNTYIQYNVQEEEESEPHEPMRGRTPTKATNNAPETPVKTERRIQPYVETTSTNVAVIVANDYSQFTKYEKLENLINSFTSAHSSAIALVFDLRCLPANGSSVPIMLGSTPGLLLSYIFEEAFRMFLREDLYLPTKRQIIMNGLPEHRHSYNRMFFRGTMTHEPEIISFPLDPDTNGSTTIHKQVKPMTFIVDKNTPIRIINIVTALQTAQLCTFVYHVEGEEIQKFTDGEHLLFEPGITTSLVELGNAKVHVRQNETVNSDHTIGFHPDIILVKGEEVQSLPQTNQPSDIIQKFDPVVRIAIDLVSKKIPSQKRKPPTIPYSKRRIDSAYSEMSVPPPEFRLLALARLWNAVNYFYPYKNFLAKPWDLLHSSIPKFLTSNTELDYATAISHFIHQIHDSHAYVNSESIVKYIGTHIPPIKTKLVDNNLVISHIIEKDEIKLDGVQVGDVILKIDNQTALEKLDSMSKLFSSSTEHSSNVRLAPLLLAGPEGSNVQIVLRRVTQDDKQGKKVEEIEVSLPRILFPQSVKLPTKEQPYSILSEQDSTGNAIGYIDMRNLAHVQVLNAIEHVKNTKSLILDLRGYTKGAIYKMGRFLSKNRVTYGQSHTCLFMPSLLVDGIEPPFTVANQTLTFGDSSDQYYDGKIVGLIDASTMSHGEQACLFLKSCRPDLVLVGSSTGGAIGHPTNIVLPGNIEVGFSGLGYSTVDGKYIQIDGITPDVHVNETIEGIIRDEDEILKAAVQFLTSGRK